MIACYRIKLAPTTLCRLRNFTKIPKPIYFLYWPCVVKIHGLRIASKRESRLCVTLVLVFIIV